MPWTGKPGTGRVYSQLQRRIKHAHVSGKPTPASGDCQRLALENRHSFQEVTFLRHLRFRGIASRPGSGSWDRAGARSMAMRPVYLVTRRCVNASSIAFARVSSAGAPTRAASVFAGAGSPGDAPRASPAMSIAQAPRTRAAATPMQNVTNSVARKSTTIGRTLDLPLAASIFDPLVQCPLRAVPGIEAPEKGPAGREKWKAAEELWREDGNAPGGRPGGEGMRYIQRGFISPPSQGGVARSAGVVLAPPPRRLRRHPSSREEGNTSITMPRRIAIVEDDAAIRANYADALKKHGYEVSAHAARAEAMGAFRTRLPDLAVIDIGLGEEPDGGFTLCRELRAMAPSLPILFLTARDSDFDAVSGLRLGADDYLTKDVSLPHLLARISALFRRVDATAQPAVAEDVLHRGRLALDAQRMTATWNRQPVGLTVTEF